MSHFKALVIGDDIEDQLAPYDENIEMDPYRVEGYDDLEEVEKALGWDRHEKNTRPQGLTDPGDDLDARFEILSDWNGGELRINRETGHIEQWSRYNPLSKWDYWIVGVRGGPGFRIKPDASEKDYAPSNHRWSSSLVDEAGRGGESDHARKRAIDFEAMVRVAVDRAMEEWNEMTSITEGINPPTRSWEETLEAHGEENIDAAREEWNNHPWNAATRKARHWDAYRYFHIGEETAEASFYSEHAAMAIGDFYAIIQDGNWTARSDMGWFGMSVDQVDREQWAKQVAERIKGLPDDTWLTIIDCHI